MFSQCEPVYKTKAFETIWIFTLLNGNMPFFLEGKYSLTINEELMGRIPNSPEARNWLVSMAVERSLLLPFSQDSNSPIISFLLWESEGREKQGDRGWVTEFKVFIFEQLKVSSYNTDILRIYSLIYWILVHFTSKQHLLSAAYMSENFEIHKHARRICMAVATKTKELLI